jgi:hypothetical protein
MLDNLPWAYELPESDYLNLTAGMSLATKMIMVETLRPRLLAVTDDNLWAIVRSIVAKVLEGMRLHNDEQLENVRSVLEIGIYLMWGEVRKVLNDRHPTRLVS